MTSNLPGPKPIIIGEPGTGKTYCLRTLVECGVKPCVLFMDASQEVLSDVPEVAWHFVPPYRSSWKAAIEYAEKINLNSIESLAKMADTNRSDHAQFIKLLVALSNFVDDRTGEVLGPVDDWGPERALCIDHLTATNQMLLGLVTGGRAIRSSPEWGLAMNEQLNLVNQLVQLRCTVIMIGHLQRAMNEISGEVERLPAVIGKANNADLLNKFSEIIVTKRIGTEFLWSTAEDGFPTKTRLMPMSNKLIPSFVTLFDNWKARGGKLDVTWQDEYRPSTST